MIRILDDDGDFIAEPLGRGQRQYLDQGQQEIPRHGKYIKSKNEAYTDNVPSRGAGVDSGCGYDGGDNVS